MSNKLSFTKIKTYLECGRKYDFHYNKKLRPIQLNSALSFGKALDDALNDLLLNRDLKQAQDIFLKNYTHVAGLVTFNDNDFDKDLLELIDYKSLDLVTALHTIKVKEGINKLSTDEKERYGFACYFSLQQKGLIILDSYYKWVIPKIKEVVSVQEKLSIKNEGGDEFEGIIDLIATFKNGKTYLLDNKTTSWAYEKNSAQESFQLNSYFHFIKEKYQLDGLGFIVANKNLWKQKSKTCEKCGYKDEKTTFRTCNETVNGTRCKGKWKVDLTMSCFIDIILNDSNEITEALILETINQANNNIKQKNFAPNLTSCKQGKLVCPYFNYCFKNDMSGLEKK